MTSMNVSLPEAMKRFVEEQVEKGAYSTPSEYVRSLIREAQVKAEKERIERMLLEGLDSPVRDMTPGEWAEMRREVRQRLAGKKTG